MDFSRKAIMIPMSPTKDDIKSYLEMRMKGGPTLKAIDGRLREDIVRVVLEKISEM